MIGIGGIDDDRRQTMRIERDAERTADQPAAQKDDICLLHRRDVDRPVAASNPLIDPADRRTRPTARLLDVGLASGANRNIGCTAAHRRRFGGRISSEERRGGKEGVSTWKFWWS